MKTQSITLPSLASRPLQPTNSFSRFASFGRLAMMTLCVSLVSFAAVPKALAGANGTYEFKEASGSLNVDGERFHLPQSLLKRVAGFVDGTVTIEDRTLTLRKKATEKIVEEIAGDLAVDVEVSGPNRIVLVKSGDTFFGKTDGPIFTTFEGEFFGEDFDGELRTRVSATVEGRTLTIVIRFSGDVEGEDFSGKVTLVARKL